MPSMVARRPGRTVLGLGSSRTRRIGRTLAPFAYLAPAACLLILFVIRPLLETVRYSFMDWDGVGPMRFAGLSNYARMLQDPIFWSTFTASAAYVVSSSFLPVLIGLGLAALIARSRFQAMRHLRTVLLLPQAMTSVAVGAIFAWIYAPHFGVLNHLLDVLGLPGLKRPWLGDDSTALAAVGAIGTWVWTGYCVVTFVAAVQRIDEGLYDAARVDGANPLHQLVYITVPLIRYEIAVALVITLIRALSSGVFAIVQVTTGGMHNTRPISLYAYQLAFIQNQVGYGSAIIVGLMVLILLLSAGIMASLERG